MTMREDINDKIVDAIIESAEANGDFYASVTIDNPDGTTTEIEVNGTTESDGYCEDDYFNGTGCWVTTYADARISSVDIHRYDADGSELTPDISGVDERYIESEIRGWLAA